MLSSVSDNITINDSIPSKILFFFRYIFSLRKYKNNDDCSYNANVNINDKKRKYKTGLRSLNRPISYEGRLSNNFSGCSFEDVIGEPSMDVMENEDMTQNIQINREPVVEMKNNDLSGNIIITK